jgi:hypothetical protein
MCIKYVLSMSECEGHSGPYKCVFVVWWFGFVENHCV